MAKGASIDIWLTANQWDVVRDALVMRNTKEANTVADRIWRQLHSDHSGRYAASQKVRLIDGDPS